MTNNRITYRRRKSYNTKSNKIRTVKTPGGKLVAQYVKKTAKMPSLSIKSRTRVSGLKALRPHQYKLIAKSQRSVTRAYAGVYSPKELKERITRAFLIEEIKQVKVQTKKDEEEKRKSEKEEKKKLNKKGKRKNK